MSSARSRKAWPSIPGSTQATRRRLFWIGSRPNWPRSGDPQASDHNLRTFGTLGVLRHELRDKSVTFKLCQFKPDHDLDPKPWPCTKAIFYASCPNQSTAPTLPPTPWLQPAPKPSRGINLVLFLNGIPVATLELKSEFKQAVQNAIDRSETALSSAQRPRHQPARTAAHL